MSPLEKPPSQGQWIVDHDCVAAHRRVIDANQLSIAEQQGVANSLAAAIGARSEALTRRAIELDEQAKRRVLIADQVASLEETRREHLAMRQRLSQVRDVFFSSGAAFLREVFAHLEETETGLASHIEALTTQLAATEDPSARFDLEIRIQQLDMLRVLRERAPSGVTFAAFIAGELEKPEEGSLIQNEDRLILQALIASGRDADLALGLLRSELNNLAKIIGALDGRVIQVQANLDAHDRDVAEKQSECQALQAANAAAGQALAGVNDAVAAARATIAGEEAYLANPYNCRRWEIP